MKFVELTGKSLAVLVRDDEINANDLRRAGVSDESIVRINEQGDIELRRPKSWDIIGGLLGDFRLASRNRRVWIGPESRRRPADRSDRTVDKGEVPARLVAAAVFKTVGSYVKHAIGGFDSHALPPSLALREAPARHGGPAVRQGRSPPQCFRTRSVSCSSWVVVALAAKTRFWTFTAPNARRPFAPPRLSC